MIAVLPVLALVAAASPLDGCTASPANPGWTYACGDQFAKISDFPGRPADLRKATEVLADAQISGVRVKPRGKTWLRLDLAGEERDVLRVSFGLFRQYVSVLSMTDGSRALLCSEDEAGWCDRVLAELARSPWNARQLDGTRLEAVRPPELLGAPVRLTGGCEGSGTVNRGGAIRCPPSFMAIWAYPAEAPENFEAAVENLIVRANPGSRVRRDEVTCRVLDHETRCRRLRVEDDTKRLVSLIGVFPVEHGPLYVACFGPSEDVPPCSLVLRLK